MKLRLFALATLLAAAQAGKNGNSKGDTADDINANHVVPDTPAPVAPVASPTKNPTPSPTAAAQETLELAMGAPCTVSYNANSGKYSDNKHAKCADGYVCVPGESDTGQSGDIDGLCALETCNGKADPDDDQDTGTVRVTICHRTCSETNPWVRITIDDDAWGGADASGCGHQREHDVEIDCANKAPWTAWGANRKDYLIKWHGTREQVRQENGWTQNSQDEKTYWRYWERACPYVRQDNCCDWASGSCCGDDPNATPGPTPNPTPGPTPNPTPAPTDKPTPAPTPGPTADPSASPSASPTIFEGVQCPTFDTVRLLGTNHVPGEHYVENDRYPIQVTSLGSTNADGRATVTYRFCPSLMKDSAEFYLGSTNPDMECTTLPGDSECQEHTAVCTETASSKFAIVNVFAKRPSDQGGNSNLLPECCDGEGPVREFTFRLACECPNYTETF